MEHIHGANVARSLKSWANCNRKLVNYNSHKIFLIRCRRAKVFPQHILKTAKCIDHLVVEESPLINQCHSALKDFQRKILNLEISFIHWKIKQLESNKILAVNDLKNTLNTSDLDRFKNSQEKFYCNQLKKIKAKQINKFNKLVKLQNPIQRVEVNNKWIVNHSDVDVPNEVQYILSLGEKFNLPYEKGNEPLKDLIIDLEYILDMFEDETSIQIRNQCINVTTNFVRSNKPLSFQRKQFQNMIKQTAIFLSKNKDNILVLKADKGNTTVIINRTEYLEKSQNILRDETTYKKLKKDPTITVQNKNKKIIDTLVREGFIDNEQGKKLKTGAANPPKIYFQPKIHKNNRPFRPIVSFVGSPLYSLTGFLASLLNGMFVKNDSYVRNSFEFVNDIKSIKLPKDYQLISLDVISLFTNIPTDIVINIVNKKWHLIENEIKIPLHRFVELLTFIFDNNYFQYQDEFYQQIYGLGMGNCLSPICSDLVMQDLQDQCIKKLPFQLPFFKRYVDDIITSIPINQEQSILDIFNCYHPKLQFTLEKEINNSIAFLDVRLIRHNQLIETDWYHKPTFSERFLNYSSEHSLKQKINVINNLKIRATSLSSINFHNKNLKYIESMLIKNNYPISMIKKILNKKTVVKSTNQNDREVYCKIPYIDCLSEQIKNTFKGHTTKKQEKIKITTRSHNTIKRRFFSKTKSKNKKELKSGIIYNIPCTQCPKSYVGQTGRYLKQRLNEHKNDQRNFLLKSNPTALVEHKIETGHNFDFDNTTILQTQSNYKKRLFAEMIEIQKNKNCVNKRTDVENLSTAYFNILSKIK